jgi:hypothetical protein
MLIFRKKLIKGNPMKKILLILAMTCSLFYTTYAEQYDDAYIETKILKSHQIRQHPRYHLISTLNIDPRYDVIFVEFCKFPKNEELIVSMRRLLQSNPADFKEQMHFKIINDQHWENLEKGESVPYFFVSPIGFAVGEKLTLRIESPSGNFKKEIDIVPIPIYAESTSRDFSLDAVMTTCNPSFFKIQLTGLNENEEITFQSVSGREKIEDKCQYNSSGGIVFTPDVVGKKGGVATLTITRKSGSKLKVKLPWGTQQGDYVSGKQIYRN